MVFSTSESCPSSYVTWHQSHVPLTSVFSTHKSSALCLDLVSQRRDVEMPLWKQCGVFVAFTSWTSLSPLTGHNFPNSVCLGGSVPLHDCFIFYPPFSVVISEEISSARPSIIPSLLKFLSKIQCIILSDDKISPILSDGSLFYLFLVESWQAAISFDCFLLFWHKKFWLFLPQDCYQLLGQLNGESWKANISKWVHVNTSHFTPTSFPLPILYPLSPTRNPSFQGHPYAYFLLSPTIHRKQFKNCNLKSTTDNKLFRKVQNLF